MASCVECTQAESPESGRGKVQSEADEQIPSPSPDWTGHLQLLREKELQAAVRARCMVLCDLCVKEMSEP